MVVGVSSDPEFDITEHVDLVHYEVESKHHIHGTECLCGFTSHAARERTKHIVTATLVAAGLEEELR